MSKMFAEVNPPEEVGRSLLELSEKFAFTQAAPTGANGYTFFAINKISGRQVAVKYYYWGGDEKFHAEPVHLTRLSSPNIIPISDAAVVGSEWAYFVTAYCSRGDLDKMISAGPVGLHESINIVSGVLNGLTYLHGERLIHRDLKPPNIFISDEGMPMIGDFGSVKALPEFVAEVPGSGHSPLYRPPESIQTHFYGIPGDLYQAGLVLYQLLGGYLPYLDTKWLTGKERRLYDAMQDCIDKSIYATQCLEARIVGGRLLDMNSLPPWVPANLRRAINKSCNVDPGKRFQSASEFSAKLHALLAGCRDWRIVEGLPVLESRTSYRIVPAGGLYRVEKRRSAGWRHDNSFEEGTVSDLVGKINEILKH